MFYRLCFGALLFAGLALPLTGCTNNKGLDSISISPNSNLQLVVGNPATLQLTATGTFGNGSHSTTGPVTGVSWTSAIPDVASVSSTGLVSAGSTAGDTTIKATAMGYNGPVSSSVEVTVAAASGGTGGTGTTSSQGLISLTIIPSSISVGNLQDTGNFLAIGTYDVAPQIRDVTNSAIWLSSLPNVFPVDTNTGGDTGATAGIVTAYGSGTNATIIAEMVDPVTGSIQYATAAFSCPLVNPCPCPLCNPPIIAADSCPTAPITGSCFPGSQTPSLLTTVTVYNEGVNNSNWLVTASSATGTPNVIHCGPGWALQNGLPAGTDSVCVETFPVGYAAVLTATQPTAATTGTFGGWSYNCAPNPDPPTANGPNSCTIILPVGIEPTNITVGAIFN
ncbi:MAG: Ig-like domain-containing protein [Terracidiphilus sp.]|jgi:hypothetical protein